MLKEMKTGKVPGSSNVLLELIAASRAFEIQVMIKLSQ